ncbi:MAG: PLP-dependent cysteine synthase family protein [Lachnospiraceae bacterium]
MSKIKKSITELVGNTPLVELSNYESKYNLKARLIGKLEYLNPTGSVKDRAALSMIEKGESEGKLKPGDTIVESTSGNTGISLVAFASAKGYRCHIFMEPGCTPERVQIMEAYGATVQYYKDIPGIQEVLQNYGFDTERIVALIQKYADEHGYYYTSQLYNEANPQAHMRTTGPEIVRDTEGKVDFAVMLAGTAGTLSGVGTYLQKNIPGVKIVAVQPTLDSLFSPQDPDRATIDGVVNFDGPDRRAQPFITTNNLTYDECISVPGDSAYATARELAQSDGLFLGASAAAAVYAGRQLAERPENEGKNIVVILPDDGMKYLSSKMYR